MNKVKQKIAIAEACGWIKFWQPTGSDEGIGHWEWHLGNQNKRTPPDYLNDLNAMHEAEKVLLKIDDFCGYWETYSNVLTAKIGCMDIFHATAAQRAEAFLRTIGKWVE